MDIQILLLYVFGGFILGVLVMAKPLLDLKAEQKMLKKRCEKTSIGADDSELRVKTLENKVKTLEAALEKSLKNGN